jgi:hypothetical protein
LARTAWNTLARPVGTIFAALAVAGATSCSDSPTTPSPPAVATIEVGAESFRVLLTTEAQVRGAEAARDGGPASIPVGRIVAGTGANTGWTWHLEELTFAEAAIELCDGLPSHVEKAGPTFGNGQYCPWSARVTMIESQE